MVNLGKTPLSECVSVYQKLQVNPGLPVQKALIQLQRQVCLVCDHGVFPK